MKRKKYSGPSNRFNNITAVVIHYLKKQTLCFSPQQKYNQISNTDPLKMAMRGLLKLDTKISRSFINNLRSKDTNINIKV